MIASVILVVGFMGMITAITIGSEMVATARRQTLAAQIITHEINRLRMLPWDDIGGTNDIVGLGDVTLVAYPAYNADGQFDSAMGASGIAPADWKISRTVSDPVSNLREVTLTLQWIKSGTNAVANQPTGSWLDKLAFYRPSSASRTYTRSMTTAIGKYGLNLSSQR